MNIEIVNEINLLPDIDSLQDSAQINTVFTTLEKLFPNDLYSIIGKKGHRYHDNLTQLALYCALKLLPEEEIEHIDRSKLGVIMATRYGNFTQGYKINAHAVADSKPFSAQLFPNGTFSSTAVTVSIALAAQGMNLTLDAGDLGLYAALKIAGQYMRSGIIDHCLLVAGDEYHSFTAEHYQNQHGHPLQIFSGVNAMLIKKTASEPAREIISAAILTNEDDIEPFLTNQLNNSWKEEYHVSVSGISDSPSSVTYLNELNACGGLFRSMSLGVLTPLYQYSKINLKGTTGYKGCILITKSVDRKIGVCVINYKN